LEGIAKPFADSSDTRSGGEITIT
jgi:hypothetical protein